MFSIIKNFSGISVILTLTFTLAYIQNTEVNTRSGSWKAVSRGITGLTIQVLMIDSRNSDILYCKTQSSGI